MNVNWGPGERNWPRDIGQGDRDHAIWLYYTN
jgi:hypothetical protein